MVSFSASKEDGRLSISTGILKPKPAANSASLRVLQLSAEAEAASADADITSANAMDKSFIVFPPVLGTYI
jgi:hypothetical protein